MRAGWERQLLGFRTENRLDPLVLLRSRAPLHFSPALAIRRTKENAGRTRTQGAADGNPGTARFTVNQFLSLLPGFLPPGLACAYLLELTYGVEKRLNDLEVGTQPPVQEQKQQRN